MFVKLKRASIYRGIKYSSGDIIEVGDDLGNRMISAGQAYRSNQTEFKTQKSKNIKSDDLEKLTVKELEELAQEKGIKLESKMKKAEIIDLIKGAN